MSRNDIVLLDCGSRSRSSVRLPRSARAAARLIAVVVLPTPPFWLAIATIISGRSKRKDCNRKERTGNWIIEWLGNWVIARTSENVPDYSLPNYPITQFTDHILYLPRSSGSRLS